MRCKYSRPRVYRRGGAPTFWGYMDRPSPTFPGDAGDVGDLMRGVSAGVRSGGCTWVDGPRGKWLSFDGTSGQVSLGTPAALEIYPAFTLAASIVRPSPALGARHFVVAKDFSTGNRGYAFGEFNGFFYSEIFGSNFISGIGPRIDDGAVHRLHYAHDSSNVYGYVDGLLMGSNTFTTLPANASAPWYIGRRAYVGAEGYFPGSIGEVAIYPRALSPAEVARDYADPDWRLRPPNRAKAARSIARAATGPFPWYLDPSMSGGFRETGFNL